MLKISLFSLRPWLKILPIEKIKTIQSDWDGDYRILAPILASFGITFQHLCPHTHNQNGKVERKHHHIIETTLTLLAQSSMPFKF